MSDRPSSDDIVQWHKRFAIACNNRAWELVERADRLPAEVHEMLHAAHAAAWHWARVGTELNEARANMLLGMAHALAGEGSLGLRYAMLAFNYFNEHDAPAWEQAFAHAALAAAAHSAGNASLHAEHHAEAERLGQAIVDAGERAVFLRSFAQITRP